MSHTIIIQPKGLTFEADEDETILDAAAKAGIKMLKSCDNGICEICRATLKSGQVDTPYGIFDEHHPDVNPLLPCVSKAKSNLIVEQKKVLAPGEIPLQHIAFQIKEVKPLTDDVYEVNLLSPAGKLPDFHAGQYLELLIEDNENPFTIASAPGGREVQLHLGVSEDNPTSLEILKYLQDNLTVRARLPRGSVFIKPERDASNLHDPLVFVVAGTGFAQAKSMIEDQFKHQHSAMYLYWINRDASGFYSDLPKQWQQDNRIHYTQLTPENPDCEFYSSNPVEDLIAQQFPQLESLQFVLCGGPNFVYSVLDGLEAKGADVSQVMSDVFAYAPRP
jgi:CDP-4-dehydro-6-deoxyglucose reductase